MWMKLEFKGVQFYILSMFAKSNKQKKNKNVKYKATLEQKGEKMEKEKCCPDT